MPWFAIRNLGNLALFRPRLKETCAAAAAAGNFLIPRRAVLRREWTQESRVRPQHGGDSVSSGQLLAQGARRTRCERVQLFSHGLRSYLFVPSQGMPEAISPSVQRLIGVAGARCWLPIRTFGELCDVFARRGAGRSPAQPGIASFSSVFEASTSRRW